VISDVGLIGGIAVGVVVVVWLVYWKLRARRRRAE
jgi:hypothetical protein